eukprot:CAMPEP_0176358648 /NCGR_PEP_ID=MMETSP0126-20121128/15730_1 /TAXON_ID=141414 ORGANISM="Strombidinopsis acuminatum, Strain SPMC142" /NCGR_SAMPLE_ID=MMETSP0126 /ASSEMBLY_ACC=CAM_ASM_000229 /LENGTH=98 /DNA_ID=CAMNT_0017712959 /DNA_START=124 /DNA_END=420 /DNA_ORIENTATION=+
MQASSNTNANVSDANNQVPTEQRKNNMIIGKIGQAKSKKASSAKKTNESIIANGNSKEKISKINLTQDDDTVNITNDESQLKIESRKTSTGAPKKAAV